MATLLTQPPPAEALSPASLSLYLAASLSLFLAFAAALVQALALISSSFFSLSYFSGFGNAAGPTTASTNLELPQFEGVGRGLSFSLDHGG